MIDATFGEYFKSKRIGLRKTLRAFCREHDLDPGNISKLERGRISATKSWETLLKYGRWLHLSYAEFQEFKDLAAISAGRIPRDLTEKELANRLPILFKVARSVTPEELRENLLAMVEIIRESENA